MSDKKIAGKKLAACKNFGFLNRIRNLIRITRNNKLYIKEMREEEDNYPRTKLKLKLT